MVLGLFKKRKAKKVRKKKTASKKKVAKKARPRRKAAARKKTAKTVARKVKAAVPELVQVGEITHYFPHVNAGVIKVSAGEISIGDTLEIKGHTTDFKQKIKSMQIDHVPVEKARKGDEIGLLVKKRVRTGDAVYKV